MKKSLIALAVLGAFATGAQAQSTNVTIGGVIQANVKSYKVSDTARVVENELRIDDDLTSRFWLTGSEDLGGGLSAIFYVQNRFNTDVSSALGSGNGLANGDTYVGLKGKSWGQITLGKHTMMHGQGSAVEFGKNGTPAIPNSMISSKTILGYVGATSVYASRVLNSALYKSPKFGDFSFSAGVAASGNAAGGGGTGEGTVTGTAGYSDGNAFFLQGNYSAGPIYVNAAYWTTEAEGAAVTDQTQWRLSASYAFGNGFKVGAQYDRATIDNTPAAGTNRTRSAWNIPVSYTFGKNTVMASYTKAGDFSNAANSGAKMWVVGYDHALSKRTNVGVFYMRLDNDANANYTPRGSGSSANGTTLLAGEAASIFTLGVVHKF
jgi:predicted porin